MRSQNVIEEKGKNGQKNLHNKDQHVYNNGYELRSRAIKKSVVAGIIEGYDELKKHSKKSPDLQFEEFSLTKQDTRP